MTKKELHSHIGPKVITMISDPTFAHIIECAREEMPMGIISGDPTSIIRNEGKMQGWIGCLHFLKTIGKLKTEEPQVTTHQLYADPNTENQPKK